MFYCSTMLVFLNIFLILGDPNDRTLRKIEADILIPDLMDTRIQKYDCHSQLAGLLICFCIRVQIFV